MQGLFCCSKVVCCTRVVSLAAVARVMAMAIAAVPSDAGRRKQRQVGDVLTGLQTGTGASGAVLVNHLA